MVAPDGAPGPAWSPHTRRSPACGVSCRTGRPCQLGELSEAERLARSADQAWLRVWTEILVLAFLTDNPLPAVPAPLCRRWRELAPRARECLLAQVAGHAAGIRAAALRPHYDPARFTEVLAAAAASRLNNPAAARVRPGRPGSSRRCAGCMRSNGSARWAGPGWPPATTPRRSTSTCRDCRTGPGSGWVSASGRCGGIHCR